MKKALLALPLLLLLGGGGTVGLAALGVVKVPFLPFGKKKGPPPPKDDGRGGPLAATLALLDSWERQAEATKPPKAPAPPAPPPDTGPGETKLASLWNEMPTDKVAALVAKWPEAQLGRILAQMDDEAVTNLLAFLPPARAASLSRTVAGATDERAQKVRPKT